MCVKVQIGNTVAFVMVGGPTYVLDGVRFEWSDRFGPNGVDRHGREKKLPGVRHQFWKALQWWIQQGKRVTETGACVYEVPPEARRVHIIGKHWLYVQDGWTQEQIDAKVTQMLSAAHRRLERRKANS